MEDGDQYYGSLPYGEVRTYRELSILLNHGFHIPMLRGFTQKHVRDHYPGWTWSALRTTLEAAGVVVRRPGVPLRCDPLVLRVLFDRGGYWRVEWLGGRITRGWVRR